MISSALIRRMSARSTNARMLSSVPPTSSPPVAKIAVVSVGDSVLHKDKAAGVVGDKVQGGACSVATTAIADAQELARKASVAVGISEPTVADKVRDAADSVAKAAKSTANTAATTAHKVAVAVGLRDATNAGDSIHDVAKQAFDPKTKN